MVNNGDIPHYSARTANTNALTLNNEECPHYSAQTDLLRHEIRNTCNVVTTKDRYIEIR
jgi:hypothetical protein